MTELTSVYDRAAQAGSIALWVLLTGCGGTPDTPPVARVADSATIVPHPGHDSLPQRIVLTETAAIAAGIRVEGLGAGDAALDDAAIEAPGQVVADPSRTAFVSARAAGRLERLGAVTGDRVVAHQTVAWVMSPAYLTAQQDLRQAGARAALLAGTSDSAGGQALAQAARARLKLYGVPEAEVDRIAGGGEPQALLQVTAPFEGSLVEGLTLAGASVEAGTPIFRLIDLRELDVAADVPERFLPALRIGQRATVMLAAYPDLRISGRIERIRDELDPTTRTIEALVHVDNPTRVLRPGMFAKVQLHVSGPVGSQRRPSGAFQLPAAAVLAEQAERYLFVEVAPYTYERRIVELVTRDEATGSAARDEVLVRGPLTAGDRVVVRGAFTLKSELAKAGFAED